MTGENTDLNRQVELFMAAIRAEGARSVAAIEEKTEAETRAALAEARAAEEKRAAETARFEAARAKTQGNRRMSEGRSALRAELAAQRSEIQRSVFAAAEAKLSAFAKSADYAPWLQKSADSLAKTLGPCTLFARSADLALFQVPAGCTAKTDDSITLGGLKAAGETADADDTLAARLNAQRGWFLSHSGLSIDF